MSRSFQDKNGKSWTILLDAPTLEDIKNQFKVDLTALSEDPFNQLAADPIKLVNILYLVCKDQCDQQGVTSREFGRNLKPGLDEPTEALLEALIDFFPSGKRSSIRALLSTNQEMNEKGTLEMVKKLQDPKIQKKYLDRAIQRSMKEIDKALEENLSQESIG